jgi:hypothetical protein
VSCDAKTKTATFSHTASFAPGKVYTATITSGASSLSGGIPLAKDFFWNFTTSTCSLGSVQLGAAASFAVMASTGMTNAGPTSITGDIGVSPATGLTGFPPGVLTVKKHLGNLDAAQPTST